MKPVAVRLPAGHPWPGGRRCLGFADARWLDAPEAGLPPERLRAADGGRGFRPTPRYDGTDLRTVAGPVAAGPGLALLPASASGAPGPVAVPLSEPGLVHRVELVGAGEPRGAAAVLAAPGSRRAPDLVPGACPAVPSHR